MKIYGQLEDAQIEGLSDDPANLPKGRFWLNTTSERIKAFIQGAVRVLVTENQVQTITNKTVDGDNNTLQNIGISSLKTIPADANKLLARNASGAVVSTDEVSLGIIKESHKETLVASAASIVDLSANTRRVILTGTVATALHGIVITGTRIISIHNQTDKNLTIKHQSTSAAASDRITTPKGTDLNIKAGGVVELYFDATLSTWIINTGSGSGGGELIVSNAQSIANNGQISISQTDPRQFLRVNSTGGPITLNSQPFGSITSTEPIEFMLVSDDNDNTVSFAYNDADFGCIGNFDLIELSKNFPIKGTFHPVTKRIYLARF